MIQCHSPCLGATELLQDGSDGHILYFCGIEIRILCDSGFENVVEELFWVCVFETALFGARDGSADGGEKDDVVGILLEDVFQAFLNET